MAAMASSKARASSSFQAPVRRAMSPGTGGRFGFNHAQGLLEQQQHDVIERPALLASDLLDALGYPLVDVAQQEVGHGLDPRGDDQHTATDGRLQGLRLVSRGASRGQSQASSSSVGTIESALNTKNAV